MTAQSRIRRPGAENLDSVRFTQNIAGNNGRVTPRRRVHPGHNTVQASEPVQGSEPLDITIDPGGNPWSTIMPSDKIAEVRLR